MHQVAKVIQTYSVNNPHLYAFSQRTINEWNRLPGECVHATSVNMFKNKIDNYFKRSGYV